MGRAFRAPDWKRSGKERRALRYLRAEQKVGPDSVGSGGGRRAKEHGVKFRKMGHSALSCQN